jgi:hypothetical protein
MPNTRGNNLAGANNSAEDLARVIRDEKIIAQRLEDVPLRTIAANVGCALSTVQAAVTRWMEEHGPAAEQVEELRTVQAAQIDALYAKAWPRVMRPLRDSDGAIIYDGNGDDRQRVEEVDVPVAQLVIKLWERKSRLFGADLQPMLGIAPPLTREMLAQTLGWAGAEEVPIDVDGEELPDDQPAAIEPGASLTRSS